MVGQRREGLVVHVVGAPRAGTTTLVRELGKLMSDTFIAFPASSDMPAKAACWEQALRKHFRAHMAALRVASDGQGSIIDGSIGSLLARVEVELKHARLTTNEAAAIFEFGRLLQQRSPLPNVIIHLDTTPAGLDARARPDESLALDDHQVLDERVRVSVDALSSEEHGVELYRRKWNDFGKTAPVSAYALDSHINPRHHAPPRPTPLCWLLAERFALSPTRRCATPSSARRHPSAVSRRWRRRRKPPSRGSSTMRGRRPASGRPPPRPPPSAASTARRRLLSNRHLRRRRRRPEAPAALTLARARRSA